MGSGECSLFTLRTSLDSVQWLHTLGLDFPAKNFEKMLVYAKRWCIISDQWFYADSGQTNTHTHTRALRCCQKILASPTWLACRCTTEIAQVGGCYAIQGHSRSLILLLIDSLYITSCQWLILACIPFVTVSKLLEVFSQIYTSYYLLLTYSIRVYPKLITTTFVIKKLETLPCHMVKKAFRTI